MHSYDAQSVLLLSLHAPEDSLLLVPFQCSSRQSIAATAHQIPQPPYLEMSMLWANP